MSTMPIVERPLSYAATHKARPEYRGGGWAGTLKSARQRGFNDDLSSPAYVQWWLYASAEDLLRAPSDWRWQMEQAVRARYRQTGR